MAVVGVKPAVAFKINEKNESNRGADSSFYRSNLSEVWGTSCGITLYV